MFPSLKAPQMVAVLKRKPLRYRVDRQEGSHRKMRSEAGYPELLFSFHDRVTLGPGAVKKILCKDVGLSEENALKHLARRLK